LSDIFRNIPRDIKILKFGERGEFERRYNEEEEYHGDVQDGATFMNLNGAAGAHNIIFYLK
jgi:hypothetical protein